MVNNQLDRVEKATTKEDKEQDLGNIELQKKSAMALLSVSWLCCLCHSCLGWLTQLCPVLGISLPHLFRLDTCTCT